MSATELSVILSNVGEDLPVAFELDGDRRDLADFDGVVDVAGESTGPFYEWGLVRMTGNLGVQLTAPDGTVHTHAVSYFTQLLETDDLRPAVRAGDGDARVAARVETEAETGAESEMESEPPSVEDDLEGADADAGTARGASLGPTDGAEVLDEPSAPQGALAAERDAPTRADPADADAADDRESDGSSTVETGTGEAGDTETAAGEPAEHDDDTAGESDRSAPTTVEGLRDRATDRSLTTYERQNAIRELAALGPEAAPALDHLADDAPEEAERALADSLRPE
jgi:hypothetical protein